MEDTPRRISLPWPRLLPVTVACLGALLMVKSIALVRAAAPAASAPAASAHPAPPKPAPAAPQAAPAPTLAPAPAAEQPAPVSESERALLLDLRQRRQELESRAQEAAARDALLAATERRIGQRVEELKALQAKLEALESSRRERDEVSWRGLVKVYETMKPRDAATIMNDLDMAVLLGVLDRMKESKVAPILAAMQPDRARQITTELAQHRQRANTPGRPATANTPPAPPTRGG